jgi:streptogramin lyase
MGADDRGVRTWSTRLAGVAITVGLVLSGVGAGDAGAVLERAIHSAANEVPVPGHATVIRVDAGTGEVLAVLPTGPDPLLLRVAAGQLWTLNFGDGTLTHVDPATDTATTIDVGVVVAIESDGEDLWVARDGSVVARLDGVSGEEEMALQLSDEPLFALRDAGFIAVAGGSVWLTVPPPDARFTQQLWRIDPRSGDVLARVPLGPDPLPPFIDGAYLWIVTTGDQGLTRIDIGSLEAVPVDVERFPWSLAAGDGSMWLGHQVFPRVRRFDPDTLEISADIALDADPRGLAFGGGRLWVATENTLLSIDPATDEVTSIAEFGPFPTDTGLTSVAYLDGAVWVSIE